MKKHLLTLVCAIACSSSAAAFTHQHVKQYISNPEPYVGVDAQMRHSRFQKGFGGNVFTKYHPGANVFLGVKLSDFLCLEAGHNVSVKKNRTTSLSNNETAVGIPVTHAPAIHRGTTKFKNWYAELVGTTPIYKQDCISLLTSVGLTRAAIFAKDKLVQNSGPFPPIAFPDNVGVQTFKKKKTFLTAGVGLQFAVDEKTFCRAKVNWENSSRFKSIHAIERANAVLKPRDNFTYSLGVVFKFC